MMIGTREEMDGTNSVQHLIKIKKIKKKRRERFHPHPNLLTAFIIPNYVGSFYHSQKILLEDMMAL